MGDTKEKIIMTALQLFARDGYEGGNGVILAKGEITLRIHEEHKSCGTNKWHTLIAMNN